MIKNNNGLLVNKINKFKKCPKCNSTSCRLMYSGDMYKCQKCFATFPNLDKKDKQVKLFSKEKEK